MKIVQTFWSSYANLTVNYYGWIRLGMNGETYGTLTGDFRLI